MNAVRPGVDIKSTMAYARYLGPGTGATVDLPDAVRALAVKEPARHRMRSPCLPVPGRRAPAPHARPTGTRYPHGKSSASPRHPVRDGRLRDARHAAGTVLMLLGIPDRVIDQIMGWEPGGAARMRARYLDVTDPMFKEQPGRSSAPSGKPRRILPWTKMQDDEP
ncbi:hypothetical protein [Streptomyces sp. NPDC052496]|uniref:hypothetical protein n=1 Tax=Streptomyces sp. NPDC052496 TaxID=3154951 RepID=UPI0034259F0D